jgi:hypothetical protein
MCVIIDKDPGVEIPFDKLELACDINKHGFGLAWVGKKKLEAIRSIETNDAKAIAKELAAFKDMRCFLHLRHVTEGQLIMENNHPFFLLKDTIGFMHNGTLWDWVPKEKQFSDSLCYARNFLEPLAKRCYASEKQVLEDPFFVKLVTKSIPNLSQSVFLFFDVAGRTLRVQEQHGKQFEGWWASNEYSFNPNHIRSSGGRKTDHPFGGTNVGSQSSSTIGSRATPFPGTTTSKLFDGTALPGVIIEQDNYTSWAATSVGSALPYRLPEQENYSDSKIRAGQIEALENAVWAAFCEDDQKDCIMNAINLVTNHDIHRKGFIGQSNLEKITDLKFLRKADLVDLIQDYPIAAGEAMCDMIFQLLAQEAEIEKLKKKLDAPSVEA